MHAFRHAGVSLMHAHLSYDSHVCDLSPVSLDVAAVGASPLSPHIYFYQLIAYQPTGDRAIGRLDG